MDMYNTGNPVGSTAPKDLSDNAQVLDKLVVGTDPMVVDRLGALRYSWAGMEYDFNTAQTGREAQFQAFLAASGFSFIGDYGPGLNFTNRNQYMLRDGYAYRLAPSTTVPYTTTGNWALESGNFVLFSQDDVLRQDLAENTGATLVSTASGQDVQEELDSLKAAAANIDWVFDPTLIAPASAHVRPVASGGAYVDARYDLAKTLNFQRMPTRFTRHVGLTGSAAEMPDGSFLLITRQALAHADDPANGKIVQYRTRYGSKVVQPVETRVILDTAGVDDRDMSVGYMGSGRLGMVSSKAFANLKPVFSYSDDNGLTWSSAEITVAPNGWGTWFGIQPYPASVGGHDTLGYICFGAVVYGASTTIECVYTVDNGATWTHAVLLSGLAAENPSEATVARVGRANKWVMVYRQNATTTGKARVSFSDDLLTWSTPVDAGLTLGKNPPYLFWHEGFMYLFASFRNDAFFGDLTPDKKYANKLSYARTTSQKLLAGDVSDFSELEAIASFGSLNGYFSLNRSPLTGKVFGVINYDEKAEPLASGVSQRSSLALVTDEKMATPCDSLRGVSTYTDATPTQWRITRDQATGTLRASAVSMNLV